MKDEMKRMCAPRRAFILPPSSFILTLMLLSIGVSCGARRTPDLGRIFAGARSREGKRPIIVVPGAAGSEIVNARTGEVVWPRLSDSSDDNLELPIRPELAANRDGLVAGRVVTDARFLPLLPRVNFYKKLLGVLREDAGYQEGDWDAPAPGGDRDTFYVFPYDWRRDNVETARLFIRRVEELKRKLNRADLRFNLITHSMGGLVARYAAMYGDADLPAAPVAPQPTWAGASHINSIVMFGVPNEGSAEIFAMILRGDSLTDANRGWTRAFGKLSRRVFLPGPSMFQMLPHPDAARFLDGDLKPLKVDLYDPATWRRYGWTAVYDSSSRRRLAGDDGSAGDEQKGSTKTGADAPGAVDAYLAAALRRAKSFHEALGAPSAGAAPISLLAFGSGCVDTLDAPVISRAATKNRWLTLTRSRELRASDGGRLSRGAVRRAMYAPGDGQVTRRSLLGESLAGRRAESALYDTALPVAYAAFTCDVHAGLPSNKILHDNALTQLADEAVR